MTARPAGASAGSVGGGWSEPIDRHEMDPVAVADRLLAPVERWRATEGRAVWIEVVDHVHLTERVERVRRRRDRGDDLPLLGRSFAVKDNIDVAGLPTSAACPAFAYVPSRSAPAVEALERAGALCLGKTNLDQFATGLVGTRSPHGAPVNPVASHLIPGGSSSGSAVAVARGDVAFALGTDTAGSGRVPAAMTGIVGLKPAPGVLSTVGVVPAVGELDCLSVFAPSVAEADAVMEVLAGRSRGTASGALCVGVPAGDAMVWCDRPTRAAFDATVESLRSTHQFVEVDMAPFFAVGELLYGGPWVAARDAAFGAFLDAHPDEVDPHVWATVLEARRYTATDAFRARVRLAELAAECESAWQGADVLVLPTVARAVTIREVAERPREVSTELGRYTNFVNLLGLAALAVPGAPRADGLPFGVTVLGRPGTEAAVGAVARAVAGDPAETVRRPPEGTVSLAVAGAHMRGFELNSRLTDRGAVLVRRTLTAPHYRLYALSGGPPDRPALERTGVGGRRIEVEEWWLDHTGFGAVAAEVAPPLAIGSVELDDGSWVRGFVCEPIGLADARDITRFGGWRAYRSSLVTR